MKIGPYDISVLVTDRFRLDGGAMFGVVPKPLWDKRIPGDERNRIQLACRSLVIKNGSETILVDVGAGRKYNDKQKDIYVFDPQFEPTLEKQVPGVTSVIVTHMHFDHGGGISYYDDSGKAQLSFPQARIYLQEKNFERAQNPGPRELATYFPENVEPLKNAKLTLTKDAQEIFPGITVFQLNGHTDGLQWILVKHGSEALAFPSDLIPTAHHVALPYVMGYDLCASTTMREKESFLTQAVAENWWVVFEHDADNAIARLGRNSKGVYEVAEMGRIEEYKP